MIEYATRWPWLPAALATVSTEKVRKERETSRSLSEDLVSGSSGQRNELRKDLPPELRVGNKESVDEISSCDRGG